MSAASTAATIGLQIGADDKQAVKALTDLMKNLGMVEAKASGVSSELRDLAVDGFEKMAAGAGKAAVNTAKWGLGLGALSATAAAVGLVDMAANFATGASAMGRSADMLGIPVNKLSQFGIAAHLAGSSAEQMQASLTGLQDTVSRAAFGDSNTAFSEFRNIGIDVGDAHRGAAKDYLAMLPKIADETERLAKVNVHAAEHFLDVVGVGKDLFPMMRHGSAGLQPYLKQAADMNPIQDEDVDRARKLEVTIAGLEERFASFGREAGAAAAPGLTHALDELQKFLAGHKQDVADFFGEVEHGIEWLATPRNLSWLHEEVDKIIGGFKEAGHLVEELDHSVMFRRLLGLPQEPGATEGGPSVSHGIPTEDDGGALESAIAGAHGPNLFQRLFPSIFGSGKGGTPSGAVSGSTQAGMAALVKMGWQPGDAAGLIGNAQQESGLNPRSGAGTAHQGLFQWDDDRRKAIEAHFHKPLMDMSFEEQLAAANWELTEGKFKGVGDRLRSGSHDAGRAAAIVDGSYEMPANPGTPELAAEDAKRAANARRAMMGYDPNARQTGSQTSQMDPAPFALPADAGTRRMAADARAGTPTNTSDATAAASAEARLARLRVEIHHTNAPPGTTTTVTHDSPGFVDVDPPRTMGAMPTTGSQRDVVRDGY